MDRRSILRGTLASGALLALPGRALAQSVTDQFDQVFGAVPNPAAVEPVHPMLPVVAPPNPLYDAKLREIAKRELERAGPTVWRRDLVGIADFARPSTLPRLHFVHLEKGEIRSFFVSHGRGSDPEHSGFLQTFSNSVGSEATSRGAYLTCEWYKGKYGTSIRLEGLDQDNSNAHDRAIVMHPAAYAADDMIQKFGKLGRSEGCFAMGPEHFNEALWHLSGGRLLYADRIEV
ncbi:murein L,D-transpeptidase catalytic domain-containing protein [Novosphingobium aquiterrae]|uniref:Murein L,D-transpeptidase catalytic domain-containing protein n=1 Tax=Novosphingobium aquiterrae TaxID=624388 RepID=A0ABV6PG95_9SPHN